jgi:hypothetical protein
MLILAFGYGLKLSANSVQGDAVAAEPGNRISCADRTRSLLPEGVPEGVPEGAIE